MSDKTIKLTALSHGLGCGCKIASATLDELLGGITAGAADGLLVGNDARDDAAVFALDDDRALVATTDFFVPIVDDPFDFGRIAAANALSDVYAMGARPLLALNVVAMPLDKVPLAVVSDVLKGGQHACREAGIPIAGGHSIDAAEPIYGLAVVGEVHPGRLKRNAGAREGDALILGKPLGVGVIAAAIRRGAASDEAYRELLRWASLLNRVGEKLGARPEVHAMTDVTGYGLLGHLLELCEASGVGAIVRQQRVPVIGSAQMLLDRGIVAGAAQRNRDGCAGRVRFETAAEQALLFDPQTNGGLLVACAPDYAEEALRLFREDGCGRACVIGEVCATRGVVVC